MGWLFKNIVLSFFTDFINGLLDLFGDMITSIFDLIAEANLSNPMVVNANQFTTLFAIALVTFMTAKAYFSTYVLETDGDPDGGGVLDILTRAAQATAIISCNAWISSEFLEFSKSFVGDFTTSADAEIVSSITELLNSAINTSTLSAGVFVILILAMVIALILFVIQAGIRGGELSIMKILLPIFAVDLVGTSRDRWNAFFTSYVITYMAYAIQLLCFRCFALSLASMTVDVVGVDGIIAFGWLILMIRAPKWLEKFCYSSGVSRSIGSGLRTAAFIVPRLR